MNIETLAPNEMEPHRLTADDVLSVLGTDPRAGLTQAQARERLRRYGRNELTAEAPVPAWRKFVGQFTDWLVILLIIAASISAGLWLYERESALPYEAIAIFAIVLLNASWVTSSRHEPSRHWRRCNRCQQRTPTSFAMAPDRAFGRPNSYPATSCS